MRGRDILDVAYVLLDAIDGTTRERDDRLLPCKHCGKTENTLIEKYKSNWSVFCVTPPKFLCDNSVLLFKTKDDAVEAWNKLQENQ